jgi:DNA-binding NarL/FixJ family response regulator
VTSVRLALVDDHQPFRERLRALLQRDRHIEIVAEASTGQEVLDLAATTPVDVVCMDIRLPGMSGVETTRRLLAAIPGIRIIGLSAYADPHYVEAMLDAGAVGHFTKGDVGEALLNAIHEATAARPRFGAHIVHPGTAGDVAIAPPASAEPRPLGAREAAVLRLIAQGSDADEIARTLAIERAMVDVYRRNIMRKLNVGDDRTLADCAREWLSRPH